MRLEDLLGGGLGPDVQGIKVGQDSCPAFKELALIC